MKDLGKQYQGARPLPFIVIDNFLPVAIAEAVVGDLPDRASRDWTKLPTEDQKGKHVLADESKLPLIIRALIQELNSGYFVRFLEKLTGISELIARAGYVLPNFLHHDALPSCHGFLDGVQVLVSHYHT